MLQESYFKADYGWKGLGNAITNSFIQLGDGFVNFADAVSFGSISRNYPQRSVYINASHTQYWFHHILELISIYSALLIAFNIMPIAPLDGWKMFENTREAITGKRFSIETTQKLNRIGQIIIWVFFIVAIFMPMLI